MNSNLVIYHQVKPGIDCPDGIAAAWVLSQLFQDQADYKGWCYEFQELPDVSNYSKIFIVDFSFPQKVLEDWADQGKSISVIDHHKTALQDLSGLSDRIRKRFDLDECGATLTWRTFFGESDPIPAFLKYVKDRDLWNFQFSETEIVHEAISTMRYRLKDFGVAKTKMLFVWYDYLATLNDTQLLDYLKPIGEPRVAPRRTKIEAIAARYTFIDFQGNPDWHIPVVYLAEDGSEDRFVSDVCMKLYKQFSNAPFSACYTSNGNWSLRSDKFGNNTDVAAIAVTYGGGGHHNAAGFTASEKK